MAVPPGVNPRIIRYGNSKNARKRIPCNSSPEQVGSLEYSKFVDNWFGISPMYKSYQSGWFKRRVPDIFG
jgi:hypothetical protein